MATEDFSQLKVLVADDSAPVRLVMKTFLRKMGIEPQLVENGREVVEILSNTDFDLVFMDVHMPQMDGREAVSRIRAKDMALPIIAMTTGDNPDLLESCLTSGYSDILLKPITAENVSRIVAKQVKSV